MRTEEALRSGAPQPAAPLPPPPPPPPPPLPAPVIRYAKSCIVIKTVIGMIELLGRKLLVMR